MRPNRLAFALVLPICLVLAGPAVAADWNVGVIDYEFQPAKQQVAVGDTVVWNFSNAGHTATSERGQAERWDSGSVPAGQAFRHTFSTPGRYQYICTPHESFGMKGVVTVGTDEVARTLSRFKAKRTANRVNVSFTLNEPATVVYRLKGAARRTVNRGRLRTGKRSFTVRRLKRGSYTGTLTVADDFDKKQTTKSSFRVR
jgi:plastocyanin